jgi:small subunit ribosomal protein S1
METHDDKQEMTMEELMAESDEFKKGDIVKGKIIQVNKDNIIVDVGFKAEGVIDISEFESEEELKQFKPGDVVDVKIVKKYDSALGGPMVSYKQAIFISDNKAVEQAYNIQSELQVKLKKKIKGGVVVDLKGFTKMSMEAFMPASHIGYPPIKDINSVLGKTVPARIIEYKSGDNIVVSWRLVVESEVRKKIDDIFNKITIGEILKGKVSKITSFGAFIDIGGIDGLLHISDISWGHIKRVEDALKIGEELDVKVLDFDRGKEKISLGLKQLTPHPWDNIEENYQVGSILSGRVTGITSFGAFVEFAEGIEGMIHVSDMSWTGNVRKPSDILKTGEVVEAKVLKIDKEKRKMSLGLKQIQLNPWAKAKEKYATETILTGTVTHLAAFGAFIKLEDGIEGMMHVSDMSWTRNIRHPNEVLKVGQQVEIVVLNVNVEEERISLGLKQASANPFEKYHVKSNVQGKVTKITKSGAFVELEPEMYGFIHISQVSSRRVEKVEEEIKVGEMVWATIVKVESKNKVIELSIKEYYKSQERAEVNKYVNQEDSNGTTIGDILKAKKEEEEKEHEEEAAEEIET